MMCPHRFHELMDGRAHGGYSGGENPLAEAHADWQRHRDDFLRWWIGFDWWFRVECPAWIPEPWRRRSVVGTGQPGTRPWAWWQFDSAGPPGADECQSDYLERLGLLIPGEVDVILMSTRLTAKILESEKAVASPERRREIDAGLEELWMWYADIESDPTLGALTRH